MSQDSRFRPPRATVADIAPRSFSKRPLVALGLAATLHLAWLATGAYGYFWLVDRGVLRPIGLMFALLGLLCLGLGMARALPDGRRGEWLFLGGAIGFGLCAAAWFGAPASTILMSIDRVVPIVLGLLLSLWGWALVRGRANKVGEQRGESEST